MSQPKAPRMEEGTKHFRPTGSLLLKATPTFANASRPASPVPKAMDDKTVGKCDDSGGTALSTWIPGLRFISPPPRSSPPQQGEEELGMGLSLGSARNDGEGVFASTPCYRFILNDGVFPPYRPSPLHYALCTLHCCRLKAASFQPATSFALSHPICLDVSTASWEKSRIDPRCSVGSMIRHL